jgi:hypothetical protein
MFEPINIILSSLATWRLAHMFRHEAGPWDVFIRIREKLGDSVFGKAMDCVACMSVWFSLIIFLPGTKYFVLLLAVSAIVLFLETTHALLWANKKRFDPVVFEVKGSEYKIPGDGSGL